jgi:hypothetical protein
MSKNERNTSKEFICTCFTVRNGQTALQRKGTNGERRYKESSIISGTGAAIWTKTMGLLATVTLQAVPFRAYAPFPTYLLRGLSPQANYTNRATAGCRQS